MKIKSVKSLIGKIFVGVMCVVCVMVAGCNFNKKATDSNAGEVIKEKLYEKYGKEFEVVEVSRRSDAGFGVPPVVGNVSFYAEMYDREEDYTFGASINRDGSEFKDDYYLFKLETPIKEYIYQEITSIENIEIESYKPMFFREKENWITDSNTNYEEFFCESRAYFRLKIKINEESVEEAADKAYEICDRLDECKIKTHIVFLYNEKKVVELTPMEDSDKKDLKNRLKTNLE